MDSVDLYLVINYQVTNDRIRDFLRCRDTHTTTRFRVALHFDYITLLALKLSRNLIEAATDCGVQQFIFSSTAAPPASSLLFAFCRPTRNLQRSSTTPHGLSTALKPTLHHHHPFQRQRQHPFSTASKLNTTLMQVLKSPRKPQRARHPVSPALVNRPHMKAVCLKVTVMKPKKPNSAERKVAKVRLSSGRMVTCYISGEGKGFVVLLLGSWQLRFVCLRN